MPRQKLTEPTVVIRTSISFRPGEDDDLLAAFAKVPPRKYSAFIKSALRAGGMDVSVEGLPDDDELAESLITNFFA